MDNDSTEVAVLPRISSRDLTPAHETPIDLCPASFDVKTWRGKSMAIQAMSPAEIGFDERGQVTVHCVDWILIPDERTDEKTGEVNQFVRLVLFDKSGHHFMTSSEFGPKKLAAALRLFSAEEWKQGIPFVFAERISKRDRRTYHDIRIGVQP